RGGDGWWADRGDGYVGRAVPANRRPAQLVATRGSRRTPPERTLSARTSGSLCRQPDEGAVASLNAPDEFIVLESSIRRTCGGCHRALDDRPTVSDTPPACFGSGSSRSVGAIRSWCIPVPPSLLGLGRM